MASGYGPAAAVGLLRDGFPLCPAMPELHIETFRASIMIAGSFGPHLAVSVHDLIMEQPEPTVLP
jgi:hypothetical protein